MPSWPAGYRFKSVDFVLVGRAWLWLLYIELVLRFRPFRQVLRAAEAGVASGPRAADLARARRYARWIDVASRHHVVRARCLHRSLVLDRWLRSESLPSALRIGVRNAPEFGAHAWVDLWGEVINDFPQTVAMYTPLLSALPNQRGPERQVKASQWL